MIRPPPISTRTVTLFPYTTLFRSAVHAPGLGLRLEAPHRQPADLLLEVDVAVGVPHHGEVRGHAVDLAGDDVHVLRRMQRHHDTAHPADLLGPLAGAIDRSEEHTSELQSLMRISSAVFCLQ